MNSFVPSTIGRGQHQRRRDAESEYEAGAKGQDAHSNSRPAVRSASSQVAWQVLPATTGDQAAIYQFLTSVLQKPSAGEYQAQLEDPTYEPSDRLLIKSGRTIIAHLRLMHREMRFGRMTLPVGVIADVATSPEYRRQGCATALLRAARELLVREGAVLGLLRTEIPRFYARRGWVVCGRHCYSTAGPREILSCLRMSQEEQRRVAPFELAPPLRRVYNIRLWRQSEQAALTRLYEENTQHTYGAIVRSEAYWQWLVRRGGNQRVYVAINGPDRFELDQSLSPIVAYAATREGRIVEMMCSQEHPEASVQLLARACGDAIESDFHRVRFDGPPEAPLHALFLAAGGTHSHHEADNGMVFMANLLRPRRLLKLISHTLADRIQEAGLRLRPPCQLGVLINDEKFRVVISRRSVQLVQGTLGRSYLRCSRYAAAQLLLGHLDVHDGIATGKLAASTHVAQEMAAALLPRLPHWQPPWDDLPAA
ncbi:MAG: GNAT family N-acetyltransferase [Pirellulaceae bacterium]